MEIATRPTPGWNQREEMPTTQKTAAHLLVEKGQYHTLTNQTITDRQTGTGERDLKKKKNENV